jgi:hypothetical protein
MARKEGEASLVQLFDGKIPILDSCQFISLNYAYLLLQMNEGNKGMVLKEKEKGFFGY